MVEQRFSLEPNSGDHAQAMSQSMIWFSEKVMLKQYSADDDFS
jgi:hypothetical protein